MTAVIWMTRLIAARTAAKGYFENPDPTTRTSRDGWLHPGDNARMDEDGWFCFVDREKDMIERAGERCRAG